MENIPEQKVSSMSPRKSTKNIYWISIGIIVLLIIAVVIYRYVINKNQENNLRTPNYKLKEFERLKKRLEMLQISDIIGVMKQI